jgi:pimeloyl-ACP methyl ester carboxylesterase
MVQPAIRGMMRPVRHHRLITAGLAVVAGLAVLPAAAGSAAQSPRATPDGVSTTSLRVGSVTLHRCHLGVGRPTWCGSMRVRTARALPAANKLTVSFGWVPASDPPAGGAHTVMAQEGGPGYPSTGTAPDYAEMLGPTLRTHNLLVVDQRGTGTSTVIRCAPLQHLGNLTSTPAFRRDVARCGAQLGRRSDVFGTAYAAGDLAKVIRALQVGPVDYYGDSYGTYLGQSLLARHPGVLRSVTLDSAYEARDLDPWYRTTVTTARRAFDVVCRRSPACANATSVRGWHLISSLAHRLRHHPFSGVSVGLDNRMHRVRVNLTTLVNLVNDAGYDYQPYRDLDAAARAWLRHGDTAPLLRLWAQDIGWDDGDYVAAPTTYSDGNYYAVACTDYPQLFDTHASRHERVKQLAASTAALPARTFAPFTIKRWMSMQPYTEAYNACLDWPKPRHPAMPPVPSGPMDRTNVPVLILNGGLDSLTPAAGGAHIARQIGPAARAVVVPNTVHLVALDNPHPCGAHLVRRFVAHPGRLQSMPVGCIHSVPAIDAIGRYPRTVHGAQPGTGRAPKRLRRLASVATAAVGDAAIRFDFIDATHDQGLRGGTISYTRSGSDWVAHMHAVKWTSDSAVTGRVRFPLDGLSGVAHVSISADAMTWTMAIRWSATRPGRHAKVHVGGHRIVVPSP